MARLHAIEGSMRSVEHRLRQSHLLLHETRQGRQPGQRTLNWAGNGLRDLGLQPGTVLSAEQRPIARALMDGRDPRTGRRLVRAGNHGHQVTLGLPRSVSVLHGLAPHHLALQLEDAVAAAVTETVAVLEQWTAYGLRGGNGAGRPAARIQGSGLLGWVVWGYLTLPAGRILPAPRLHAKLMIANMVRGRDGRWSAVAGGGGRDLRRHALLAQAYLQARVRRMTSERFGFGWALDPHRGLWEVDAVPAHVRELFSEQHTPPAHRQARPQDPDGTGQDDGTIEPAPGDAPATPSTSFHFCDVRAAWRRQVRQLGVDPARLVTQCLSTALRPPRRPGTAQITRWVVRPERGVTAHHDEAARVNVLREVLQAMPDGVADLPDAERLTDEVLTHLRAVPVPADRPSVLSNSQCYLIPPHRTSH